MTAYEAMLRRALAEFDELVAARETELREQLTGAGYDAQDIDDAVAFCRPGIAKERRGIPVLVMTAFARNSISLETSADAWQP